LNCTEAERAQRPAEKVKAEAPVKGKKDERGERNAGEKVGEATDLSDLLCLFYWTKACVDAQQFYLHLYLYFYFHFHF